MKHGKYIFLILVFFTGCTTTKITSSILTNEKVTDFSSVFYAIKAKKTTAKAMPYLEIRSKKIYDQNDIKFEQRVYTFLEDQGKNLLDDVIAYALANKLKYILTIEEIDYEYTTISTPGYWSNGMYFGGGNSKEIVHELQARLYSTSDTTEIWEAEIEIKSGSYGNSQQSGESLAISLIDKLIQDGILPKSFKHLNERKSRV